VLFVSIIFILYSIIYFYSNRNLNNDFDSLPASIENLLIIIFCVLYFFEQINIPTLSVIYSRSTFWIIVGILFYVSGTLFLFLYVASLPKTQTFNHWYINSIFNILIKVLFAVAFLLNKDEIPDKPYIQKQSYI